jgi:hypothetical protein
MSWSLVAQTRVSLDADTARAVGVGFAAAARVRIGVADRGGVRTLRVVGARDARAARITMREGARAVGVHAACRDAEACGAHWVRRRTLVRCRALGGDARMVVVAGLARAAWAKISRVETEGSRIAAPSRSRRPCCARYRKRTAHQRAG